jgi:hypothetical protein
MSLFEQIFTWWRGQTIGTRVFTADFDSEMEASANLGCWSTTVP